MKTGTDGKLHLRFSKAETPKLHVKVQKPPLRVIRAFEHQGDVALVHMHNVSGGVLGGDQFDIQIDLDPEAHGMVTTTGANRIYRHRDGYRTATQTMRVHCAADSVFEYIPDSTIPFANSKYQQTSDIHLTKGAKLFWTELLAPGREAFDERFSWESMANDLRITAAGRPILIEKWQLNPADVPIESLALMGHWAHNATFVVAHCGASSQQILELEAALTELAQAHSDVDTVLGVSRLVRDGVLVRGMSTVGRKLPHLLEKFHNCARLMLLGKRLIRPRKIY
ncbi:MAG: urease accessory protein UreD [Anaerolineae bacterium]